MTPFATAVDEVRRQRVCADCGEVKPFSDFYTWRSGKPRAACKRCFRLRGKSYETDESKERELDLNRKWRNARRGKLNEDNKRRMACHRARLSAIVVFFKSRPCADCGERFPACSMDFDHVRPGKRKHIAQLVGDTESVESLEREISLCEVVCARCHRDRTHSRKAAARRRVKPMGAAQRANKAIVLEAKKAPCLMCGGRFKPWQMDFDHVVRSEKKYTISRLTTTSIRTEVLRAELTKVQLLCANCHRIKTAREEDDCAASSR